MGAPASKPTHYRIADLEADDGSDKTQVIPFNAKSIHICNEDSTNAIRFSFNGSCATVYGVLPGNRDVVFHDLGYQGTFAARSNSASTGQDVTITVWGG